MCKSVSDGAVKFKVSPDQPDEKCSMRAELRPLSEDLQRAFIFRETRDIICTCG